MSKPEPASSSRGRRPSQTESKRISHLSRSCPLLPGTWHLPWYTGTSAPPGRWSAASVWALPWWPCRWGRRRRWPHERARRAMRFYLGDKVRKRLIATVKEFLIMKSFIYLFIVIACCSKFCSIWSTVHDLCEPGTPPLYSHSSCPDNLSEKVKAMKREDLYVGLLSQSTLYLFNRFNVRIKTFFCTDSSLYCDHYTICGEHW